MKLSRFCNIRGVEVVAYAASFDGDESVGLSYAPEEIWAVRLDNDEPFELTPLEEEELTVAFSQMYYEMDDDYE